MNSDQGIVQYRPLSLDLSYRQTSTDALNYETIPIYVKSKHYCFWSPVIYNYM
jgi:hypothetical protein